MITRQPVSERVIVPWLHLLRRAFFAALLGALASGCGAGLSQDSDISTGPVVLAAASLQESLTEVANSFEIMGGTRPVLSFAATSAIARQIEQGAPADLVIAADTAWMDQLEEGGHIAPRSRENIATNRLVVVAPKGWAGPGSDPFEGGGNIAIADPSGVPAGRYARAALARMGWLDALYPRLVPTENVRAALTMVEREQVDRGIVYATDALASREVEVVYRFPSNSHPPILYLAARVATSKHREAEAFLEYLDSLEARAIFRKHGFSIPGEAETL